MSTKKVSAFSVFHSTKNKNDKKSKSRPPSGIDHPEVLRRAHSSQSVNRSLKKEHGSGSRGRRILNALKSGGSIRESIRMSGKKLKATSLTSINKDSPFDQVSLCELKNSGQKVKPKRKALESQFETTPVRHKSPGTTKISMKLSDSGAFPQTKRLSKGSLKEKDSSPSNNRSTALIAEGNSITASGSKRKGQKMNGDNLSPQKKRKMVTGSAKTPENVSNSSGDGLPYMYDSYMEASKLFECIIHPVKTDRFFTELWEKKPLMVKRHIPNYNRGWFSTSEFDRILRQDNVQWGVNLDATSFVDNKRETHNQSGKAYAPVVWDMYQAGCSLRLLNPQTYSRNVWKVLSVLQEYFGCCVGANIYLTPSGTQGFAPHYDDIEAFIIQLEGKKHWKLYSPRTDDEVLPRFSSGNFSQQDMGEPILDTVLEAGDLLYFPRGTIHQANATEEHSLHITVSCYQLNSWGDYLQKLLPTAIQMALDENSEFREGLPRDYLNYMGIVNSERELPQREAFKDKAVSLVKSLIDVLPLDSACDQMGKRYIHDTLPPVLSENEKMCSIHGAGEKWDGSLNRVLGVSEIQPETEIKLLRRNVLRLLTEEDKVRVYFNTENARVYRGVDPNYFDVTAEAKGRNVDCLFCYFGSITLYFSFCLEHGVNVMDKHYRNGELKEEEKPQLFQLLGNKYHRYTLEPPDNDMAQERKIMSLFRGSGSGVNVVIRRCRYRVVPLYLDNFMAQAIECLIQTYPDFINVEDLPMDSVSDQINVASVLYERGLLMTASPLEKAFDEPGDTETDDEEEL